MNRREALKTLIGAAIAQRIPIELQAGVPVLQPTRTVEVFAPYGTGFYINRELYEDDCYGALLRIIEHGPIHDVFLVEYREQE